MKMWIFVSAAAVAILAAGPALHAQQTAQILLPMFDAQGAPVAGFDPSDLEIFEDGKPLKILKVEPKDSEMTVTLALDNGRGMSDVLVHVRSAAKEFFKSLPLSVEAALLTTAPQPRFVVRPTKDREALAKAVDTISPSTSGGRTIETLRDIATGWKKLKPDVWPVLVVLGSTFSPELINKTQVEDALATTKNSRATVHAILFNPIGANEGDAQLAMAETFAQATRGRFEKIGSYLQFGVFTDIAKEVGKNVNRQFLVTLERPSGASGKLGALSLSPREGLMLGRITRLP